MNEPEHIISIDVSHGQAFWGYAVFTNSEFGVTLGNDLGDYLIGEPK